MAQAKARKMKAPVKAGKILEGKDLISDMARWGREATSTPEAAKRLLMDLGVMTKTGKLKTLIRG